jgi:uncharacterized membrane protein
MRLFCALLFLSMLCVFSAFKTETHKDFGLQSLHLKRDSTKGRSMPSQVLHAKAVGDSTITAQKQNMKANEKFQNFGVVMGILSLLLMCALIVTYTLPYDIVIFIILGLVITIPLGLTSGLLTLGHKKIKTKTIFAIFSSLVALGIGYGIVFYGLESCSD